MQARQKNINLTLNFLDTEEIFPDNLFMPLDRNKISQVCSDQCLVCCCVDVSNMCSHSFVAGDSESDF